MSGPRGAGPPGFYLGFTSLLVAAVLLLAPVLPTPTTRVLGELQSEAATHAPALAAALVGLWRHGPFVLAEHPLHPDQVTGAMYEPITTLLMWPAYALVGGARGFTLAWNLWHLVVLVASAAGAWVWARAWLQERDPDGWGAGLAMSLAAASVFLHLSPAVGRTEAQDYALYALHAGLLFRAGRRGGRAWAWAAVSAVPVLWSGGYGVVFFALTEPLVVLWALGCGANRDARRGLGLVAVVSVLALLPLVWAMRAHPYIGTSEARLSAPSVPVAVLFGQAEDLLRALPGYEVAPFAGLVTLTAAALAVGRSRDALAPAGIAALLLWIAAGPAPTLGGTPTWSPAAWFEVLPGPLGVVRGWCRLVAFAIPLLAVAAGALVAGAGRARGMAAAGIAGFALGEVASLRVPASWSLEPPAELVALHGAGRVPVVLPLDGLERTRRWVAPPAGPDVWRALPDNEGSYLRDALPSEPELFRSAGDVPAATDRCVVLTDAMRLREAGFDSLWVRSENLPKDGAGMAARALKAVFGAPKEERLWLLPEALPAFCAGGVPSAATSVGGPAAEPLTPEERERVRAERRAERERVRLERQRLREGGG